jgi:GT2 family glycosyltransferase
MATVMTPRPKDPLSLAIANGPAFRPGSQVTLVILTFNRPDYLEECLASVAQQTLNGFRLVVLDNASTADLSGVLDRFSGLRLDYVRNETNIGGSGNFAKAMECYSDSKYLVIFHDDDLMHPRMLEWQLSVLESDPEIQFVSTEYAEFEEGDAPRAIWDKPGFELDLYDNESDLARSLLVLGSLCFGSTMYRSSVLKRIKPDNDRFGIIGDRPFLLAAARLGKSALIRAPLVLYRRHPGQDTKIGALTAQNLIELMRDYREALPRHLNRADRQIFYGHASYYLAGYGYPRLAPEERIGATAFLRRCISAGVLRFRDVRPWMLSEMMRADGRRTLPAAIDAVRATKRRFASRRRRDQDDRPSSPIERGQARRPED